MKQQCSFCHTEKNRTAEEKKKLTNRLVRIEGQVRGLSGMVEADAYCPDILTQVSAVSAALRAFERELLAAHVRTCVADDIRAGREDSVEELNALLKKMMR
ncbi:MAG: metal-sensing transcriptional repressor [Clostridia bacterium]|nr:metal-sensing transcriptional repressor [Clostridia bacterium]